MSTSAKPRLRSLCARMLVRFRSDAEGVVAIEFALVAMPFLMLVAAIFECCLVCLGQLTLDTAMDRATRAVFTGSFQEASDGTDPGEVVAADGEQQQERGRQLARQAPRPGLRRHRGATKKAAKCERDGDGSRIPCLVTGDLVSGHAGVVHRRDAEPQDGAARPGRRATTDQHCEREAGADHRDGDDEREARERDLVTAWHARREGQHGDEVGCPDARAAGCCCHGKPPGLGPSHRSARVADEAHRRQGGQGADAGCQGNEPEVMSFDEATNDGEHGRAPGTFESPG